eukprot:gene9923-13347_t
MVKIVDIMWGALGSDVSLLFGQECGGATIWMIFILIQRAVLILLHIDKYIPFGLNFAFPLFVQLLSHKFPVFKKSFPILPIRLAESIMGRISSAKLIVTIPAHLIGSIIGTVIFHSIFPFIPLMVFEPIVYEDQDRFRGLATETLVVFLYSSIIIIFPQLLEANKLSQKLVSIPTLPLMLIGAPNRGSTINPAAIYALWYVNRFYDTSAFDSFTKSLQLEHIIGPLLGAVSAGFFCNVFFPDDPVSWKRE